MTDKQIIRIDKQDGSRVVEPDLRRLEKALSEYNPLAREAVALDFWAGERQITTKFAIYEVEGFVPYCKRK